MNFNYTSALFLCTESSKGFERKPEEKLGVSNNKELLFS